MAGITWWTPARVAALARLVAGGASYRRAAAALSRRYRRRVTVRAVNRMASRAGLHGRARGGPPRGNRNAKGKNHVGD